MKKAITLAAGLATAAAAFLAVDTAENSPPASVEEAHGGLPQTAPATAPDEPPGAGAAVSPGTDQIAGLAVRKDRRCRVELREVVTPAGEMFSAYRCVPEAPRTPHPYAHYDNGSLEVLAWSDPEAAALLGRRLAGANPAKAHAMLVRATALGGDVAHLSWLADQAYSAIRVDGDLQVDNIKRRYELAALAYRLGGDPATRRYLRSLLVDAGLNDNGLDALDDRVETMLESVRDIQRTVHGEIRYGGQNDA